MVFKLDLVMGNNRKIKTRYSVEGERWIDEGK